jgi:hypothetical protein
VVGLFGGVTFRWQLDGEKLVPMTIIETLDDPVDVGLSSRSGAGSVSFNERWKISALTR